MQNCYLSNKCIHRISLGYNIEHFFIERKPGNYYILIHKIEYVVSEDAPCPGDLFLGLVVTKWGFTFMDNK